MQKYCACATKRRRTHYETCWNAAKCHARHAKRGYATFETSKLKVTSFAELVIGTAMLPLRRSLANGCGHLQTLANGCERLRTQKQCRANTPQPPDPQSKTKTYAPEKKIMPSLPVHLSRPQPELAPLQPAGVEVTQAASFSTP